MLVELAAVDPEHPSTFDVKVDDLKVGLLHLAVEPGDEAWAGVIWAHRTARKHKGAFAEAYNAIFRNPRIVGLSSGIIMSQHAIRFWQTLRPINGLRKFELVPIYPPQQQEDGSGEDPETCPIYGPINMRRMTSTWCLCRSREIAEKRRRRQDQVVIAADGGDDDDPDDLYSIGRLG